MLSLRDDIDYTYAKQSDFNQQEKKNFVFVNCAPLSASPGFQTDGVENYMKLWTVEMIFVKRDSSGSPPEQYTKILDECDELVDRFVNALNLLEPGDFTIRSITQRPAIQVLAEILTGYFLSFQLFVSDQFEYCEDCP